MLEVMEAPSIEVRALMASHANGSSPQRPLWEPRNRGYSAGLSPSPRTSSPRSPGSQIGSLPSYDPNHVSEIKNTFINITASPKASPARLPRSSTMPCCISEMASQGGEDPDLDIQEDGTIYIEDLDDSPNDRQLPVVGDGSMELSHSQTFSSDPPQEDKDREKLQHADGPNLSNLNTWESAKGSFEDSKETGISPTPVPLSPGNHQVVLDDLNFGNIGSPTLGPYASRRGLATHKKPRVHAHLHPAGDLNVPLPTTSPSSPDPPGMLMSSVGVLPSIHALLNAGAPSPIRLPSASLQLPSPALSSAPFPPPFSRPCGVQGMLGLGKPEVSSNTTVMLRNIPNKLSQGEIVGLIRDRGFGGRFDFFYSPLDFKSKCNLGYAFVNFVDSNTASRFMAHMEGTRLSPHSVGGFKSAKLSGVAWARIQGFEANVKHYRNSPVNDLEPEFRPMLFELHTGKQVDFPRPDKRPSAPVLVSSGSLGGVAAARERRSTTRELKVFVGGLSLDTTDQSLYEYMVRFGDIEEAVVISDRRTGISKGFGFCTYKSQLSVNALLNQPSHMIDGHSVAVRTYTSHR